MTLEAFTEEFCSVLGERLVMVALYGSAVAEGRTDHCADGNLMVVCERLGLEELDAMTPLVAEWAAQGSPPPLLFAVDRLLNSSHVFPIELLDIKENHRVLYGRNVLKALPIGQANLQFQLEHELKGKLIQLREGYLVASSEAEGLRALMLQSLSAFQVLLKAALRFFEVSVPTEKREAVRLLAKHMPFDLSIFQELQELRDEGGEGAGDLAEAKELFRRYLEAIERSADLISGLGRRD